MIPKHQYSKSRYSSDGKPQGIGTGCLVLAVISLGRARIASSISATGILSQLCAERSSSSMRECCLLRKLSLYPLMAAMLAGCIRLGWSVAGTLGTIFGTLRPYPRLSPGIKQGPELNFSDALMTTTAFDAMCQGVLAFGLFAVPVCYFTCLWVRVTKETNQSQLALSLYASTICWSVWQSLSNKTTPAFILEILLGFAAIADNIASESVLSNARTFRGSAFVATIRP